MKRIIPRSLLTVSVVVALLLTNLNGLIFIPVAQAERAEKPSHSQKADKVSPLLKDGSHAPADVVTVLVTLAGERSVRLSAFLAKIGIH